MGSFMSKVIKQIMQKIKQCFCIVKEMIGIFLPVFIFWFIAYLLIATFAKADEMDGLDDSVLDEMEQKLLAEGDSAEEVIFNFLAECSYGGVGNIRWWAQAKRLTRMLSKFKSPEVRRHLQQLVDNANRSNSHEYHSEIANVAKEELNKQMGKRI